MDIRETKQRVLTNKNIYVLEHHYGCNNCKINGVEIIASPLVIYIITEVKNNNEIIMNLNIEDCRGVTIARYRNIEVKNNNDFDEEMKKNLLLITSEIEKNENYYNK